MQKIVLATRNTHKVAELQKMLHGEPVQVLSLKDLPDLPEVVEDGATFEANALKKAREICQATGLPALADDSGLVVDILDGAPGVYSARFAGPQASDADNNRKLLELLQEHPDLEERRACFKSVIAFVMPGGQERVVEGSAEGVLLTELKGQGGFGYDPLFYVTEYGQTFAELPMEIKNQISHRGKAFKKIVQEIHSLLGKE